MIREVERAARSLGEGLRKRAGKASVPADLEAVLHQLLQGLTGIASQIEKAVGELRRYLEANAARTAGAPKRKASAKKGAKKSSGRKKATAKKSKSGKKTKARR